ncbi:MAG: hypothetical protein LBV09_03025 [Deferribacteraceae bacterium]|jgi:hypothetical protein|nr:hypothetical protein [Deferribacteraceae bacterium]
MKQLLVLSVLLLSFSIFFTACAAKSPVSQDTPQADKTLSQVIFNFKSSYNDRSVLTFWRKIEADGTKGERFFVGGGTTFSLMMNLPFPPFAPKTVELEAGRYYLDSYQVPIEGGKYCVSEGTHYTQRNGWDDTKGQPKYLSFTVEEGSGLTLPEVVFNGCEPTINDTQKVFTLGAVFNK